MKPLAKVIIINVALSLSCKPSVGTLDKEISDLHVSNRADNPVKQLDSLNHERNQDKIDLLAESEVLIESTKRIIQNNQKIPSFELYSDSNEFKNTKNYYIYITR